MLTLTDNYKSNLLLNEEDVEVDFKVFGKMLI